MCDVKIATGGSGSGPGTLPRAPHRCGRRRRSLSHRTPQDGGRGDRSPELTCKCLEFAWDPDPAEEPRKKRKG